MIPTPLQQRAEIAAATGRDTIAIVLALRDVANALRGGVDDFDHVSRPMGPPDPSTALGISTRSGARRATRKT